MLKELALLAVLAALPAALARPRVHNSEMVSQHENLHALSCTSRYKSVSISLDY